MHVILIGAQGSGKGTQAARIAPRLNLEHVSTGDLFRAAIASRSLIGQEVKEIYDRGDLVPDALTISLVGDRLEEIAASADESSGVDGALFDGFPRTLPQAEGLEDLLEARSERISVVVELAVPMDRLVARLAGRRVCASCGATYHVEFNPPAQTGACDRCGRELLQREDDKPEPIKRRLALYVEQTAPVLSFYRERGMLVEINGDQPIDVVSDEIVAVVTAHTDRLASIGGRG
jgi:adenylate kinase